MRRREAYRLAEYAVNPMERARQQIHFSQDSLLMREEAV